MRRKRTMPANCYKTKTNRAGLDDGTRKYERVKHNRSLNRLQEVKDSKHKHSYYNSNEEHGECKTLTIEEYNRLKASGI